MSLPDADFHAARVEHLRQAVVDFEGMNRQARRALGQSAWRERLRNARARLRRQERILAVLLGELDASELDPADRKYVAALSGLEDA